MEPLSHAEFAQRTAQDVAVVAGELLEKWRSHSSGSLSRVKVMKNLAILACSLQCVSFNQDKYEHEELRDREYSVGKLEKFLCGLELVCTFPKNCLAETSQQTEPSARFPTLNTLVTQSAQPVLSTTDKKARQKVEQSVEAFVSMSTSAINRYFKFLKGFFETKDQAKKQAESAQLDIGAQQDGKDTKRTKVDEDESYPRHVYDSLYKVMKQYAQCCCALPNSPLQTWKSHWARLELKENFPTTDNEILFHMVFSKKGSIEFVEKIKWQHVQFRVSSKQLNTKEVGFKDKECDDSGEDSTKPGYAAEITSTSEFCKLLSEDIGLGGMDVRIRDEVLLVFRRAVGIEVSIADERSISLADVLEQYSLVPKSKLLLAYILAKSVWLFYDSDFMSVRWTTETIQLFREREHEDDDCERGVDWAPYYAFSFKQIEDKDMVERLSPGHFLHRYPRVLALGALLYELGRKRRPKKQLRSRITTMPTSPLEHPTVEKIINDTVDKIQRGVENEQWPDIKLKDVETLEKYRFIVKNCIGPSLFTPSSQEGSQKDPVELEEELTIEERRATLFRKVVEPLKKLVQSTGWVDESGNIQRQHVKGAVARRKEEPVSQNPAQAVLLNTPHDPTNGTQYASTALWIKAELWLDKIKESPVTKDVVSAFQEDDALGEKRIRIAVLDTGYDPKAIFFNRFRKRRLKDWEDYVEEDQPNPKDEDGHGTHVLSVLMKVAPAADIYVARVARDTSDLQKATGNVVKAIEWAWKVCRANIVTMSFGFNEENYIDGKPVISNAILEALLKTNQRILFFAAAANDGGNRQEMYPASDVHVLSIRGTDDYGWAQGFNPPPDYNGKTCFMTLGLDVPGASLSTSKYEGADVCKSGTSVATPIAAGIAAMLLGYARVYEEDLRRILETQDDAKLAKLWGITGMSVLFKKMATEMMDKWSYLNINKFTEDPHSMRLYMIASAAQEG